MKLNSKDYILYLESELFTRIHTHLFFPIFIFCLVSYSFADVKSTNGKIDFDPSDNGNIQMSLNSTGLAIGHNNPSSNLHVSGNAIFEGNLVIGGTIGNSTLEVNGTIGYGIETVSSNTTLSGNSIVLVNTSSSNIILTLPYAGNVTGRVYRIKKMTNQNKAYLFGGGNQIDQDYHLTMEDSSSCSVISGLGSWYILSANGVSVSSNLQSWWKFDETDTTTTALDSMSSGRHGTLTNMTGNEWETGLFGGAVTLDGLNDLIDIDHDAIFLSDNFSYSVWVKLNQLSSTKGEQQYIFYKRHSGAPYTSYHVFLNNSDKWQTAYQNDLGGALTNFTHTTSPVVGVWTHLVLTRTLSELVLYVNNVPSTPFSTSGNIYPGTGVLRIGANSAAATRLDGFVDDLRFYDRVLSSEEIELLYRMGNP